MIEGVITCIEYCLQTRQSLLLFIYFIFFQGKISVPCYFIEIKGNMDTTSTSVELMKNATMDIIEILLLQLSAY